MIEELCRGSRCGGGISVAMVWTTTPKSLEFFVADSDIDMRMFARKVGVNITFQAGAVIFNKGDPGDCMYVVQSGMIEMVIGDKVIEVCGPNEAIGFMSVIDEAPRSSTARVKEAVELSIIDKRKFRFMIDEVPNFALYILGAMARRIRGMGRAM
jgi:CRP/FNR family transcriptional regulator, cyclic AMP receptor protein